MSSSRSRFLSAAFFALAAAASSREAFGQPCCAGANALSPARLALHESALAGVGFRATDFVGSYDSRRKFVGNPPKSNEADFEQDAVWAVRVAQRGQVSFLLPVVETWRRVPGIAEAGGGLGDAQLGARYDFVDAGSYRILPGIAAVFALTFPTGTPPEAASGALATDATGAGVYQGALSLAFEQTFGKLLVTASGNVTVFGARTVGDIDEQRSPALAAAAAAGWSFDSGLVTALGVSYSAELAPELEGRTVARGGRAATRLAALFGYSFTDAVRAQGSLFTDIPLRGLGQNQPCGVGFSVMGMHAWSS